MPSTVQAANSSTVFSKPLDYAELARNIKTWGRELGFQAIGIADTDLGKAGKRLEHWLAAGFHGEMGYMERHGMKRAHPAQLRPGTLSVISARMNYLPQATPGWSVIGAPDRAYIARYALGRDYHKTMRKRLQLLAQRVTQEIGAFGYRVYCDSAPVLEVELAAKSGLGWRGKHTLMLARDAGSYFFLGEIYVDLPLPPDAPLGDHCGSCNRCLDVCPTGAIVAPYRLDARRCISYLTIELKGPIPVHLRALIGNRVYGCDDCQLACPWNRFACFSEEPGFGVRNGLDAAELVDLFAWTAAEFDARMAGSAIRRIGHECWLRNLAVGLGNAPSSSAVIAALRARADAPSALVREHVAWALSRHRI